MRRCIWNVGCITFINYEDIVMIKRILFLFCLCLSFASVWGQTVERTDYGVRVDNGKICVELEVFSPSIIRVKRFPSESAPVTHSFSVVMRPEPVEYQCEEKGGWIRLFTSDLQVRLDKDLEQILFYDKNKQVLLKEKPSSSLFVPIDDAGNKAYKVSQSFLLDKEEAIYGLGQHQQGHMNQRGQTFFLQHVNMEIGIPLIHSIKGYALFWDNYSPTSFTDNEQGMCFESAVGDLCDYYFVYGGCVDKVVTGIHQLTGRAPMYPLWNFGFWQSRERYTSQDELVGVVRKYRDLKIPLDGIVQDWRYWGESDQQWNAVEFLNPKFPDPREMLRQVHDMNAHAMISVWPSFGPKTCIYAELAKQGKLMGFETFPQNNGVRVYNTYDSEARNIYWDNLKRNLFDIGMDAWWLDATEPEHTSVKEEDYDYQTGMGTYLQVRNAFPLVSVGGVYEHQRASSTNKRVCILTRSAFIGQQRYAAQIWSGDVVSDWEVLRKQIPAALNSSLTGLPYWNSDIGGFFAGQKFPGGVKNKAFHELYVRWMQFAVFTGMMRSHGTNTPREIFLFGDRGDWAFDAQEKAINLRYRLLPYIYSAAWDITSKGGSLMRPLFADFVEDKRVANISDEYLFGHSILVAPVIEKGTNRSLYLPAGSGWVDFWTGELQDGGTELQREVPMDIIPIYVKEGTILPVGPTVQYALESSWDDLQIRIYPGANGEFVLYEDEGDNYNYEKGCYSTIRMTWDNQKKCLTFHPRYGSYTGMLEQRCFRIVLVDGRKGLGLDNESCTVRVSYNGKMKVVDLSGK